MAAVELLCLKMAIFMYTLNYQLAMLLFKDNFKEIHLYYSLF